MEENRFTGGHFMEKMRTIFLMAGLVLLFMYVGHLVAGEQGMLTALIVACGINFFSYFYMFI